MTLTPEMFEAFARRASIDVADPERRAALFEFVLGYVPRLAACAAVAVADETDPAITFLVDEETGR